MKKMLIILALLSFGLVTAQMNMAAMPKQVGPTNPMPNYMPLIMNNLEEVKVTDEQLSQLKAWTDKTMPVVSAWTKELEAISLEIKNSALEQASIEDLLGLEQKAEELRIKIISKKVDCRDNAQKILDETQWQQVLGLYNMSQVGTAKEEIYSPMPQLGMVLMAHSPDLSLNDEQSKLVMAMPGQNMPLMQGLEKEISEFYSSLIVASLENKTKAEILALESKTEAKRTELIKAQADCRDQIIEVLTSEQWQKLLGFYNSPMNMAEHKMDMDHSQHDMSATTDEAQNFVKFGDNVLWLEPIVTNNNLYLGLKFEKMLMGQKEFTITKPNNETFNLTLTDDNLLELGQVQTGIWHFSSHLDDSELDFSISVYKQNISSADIYLVLAPSPSLSLRGKSNIFVYSSNNEHIHDGFSMKYQMPGMQHSSDDNEIQLEHIHPEYPDLSAMANQSPISFAMVGTWQISLTINSNPPQTVIFDIEMLNE